MSSPALLVPLVAFSAGLGAWVGGRTHATEAPGVEPLAPVATPSAHDERFARDLLEEVRGLRADLAVRSSTSERESVSSASGTSASDLVTAIGELTEALREHASRAGTAPGLGAGLRTPEPTRGFSDLGALAAAPSAERQKAHAFWSLQQLLDRYGLPTRVSLGDGRLQVTYADPSGEKGRDSTFLLFDGVVIGVY